MIHTDNESYLLAVRRWKDVEQNLRVDWLLFSKYRNVRKATVDEVLTGVKELGFNTNEVLSIFDNQCSA
jgi:ADP-dependent phosphofructokinase/glucokinase